MADIISPLLALVLGLVLIGGVLRQFRTEERGLLLAAFLFHVLAAFAQVWITQGIYGGGDMMVYFVTGATIADVVSYDPGRFFPELVALLVHQESIWPFYVMGAGGSTGTMSAVSGLLQLVLGESIYGVCVALSIAAFFGQLALYRVFREVFQTHLWRRHLVATMLVPSVVFWSSAILKETVAMAAFGWVVLGLHRFVQRRRAVGVALVLFAGFWVAMVKAYVLFALALAGAVWWYWRRANDASGGRGVDLRPGYVLIGVGAVVLMIVVLGELFPRYAVEKVGEETARLQHVGTSVQGGSYYEVAEQEERSLLGQLAFAPLALATSLFRPAFFEVRNVTMAVNAIETTTLTVLLLMAFARRSPKGLWNEIKRSPTLAFAIVFVVGFGVAVGLASTNLGTLSRYRIPMMPFFAALVLTWTARAPHGSHAHPRLPPARHVSL
ncbi:MAG: hypothetical protein RLO52_15980 [Sandaracinaceae bacterium]